MRQRETWSYNAIVTKVSFNPRGSSETWTAIRRRSRWYKGPDLLHPHWLVHGHGKPLKKSYNLGQGSSLCLRAILEERIWMAHYGRISAIWTRQTVKWRQIPLVHPSHIKCSQTVFNPSFAPSPHFHLHTQAHADENGVPVLVMTASINELS